MAATALKSQDLESFRAMLLELRARLRGEVAHLTEETISGNAGETANLAHIGMDSADPGTGTYDLEFTLGLVENEQETLDQIQSALQRIELGVYGRCSDCEGPVGKLRLQALPYTQFCINCARARESEARP